MVFSNFIYNIIVMLAILYGLRCIGQIANNKFFNSRFKHSIPLGFAWFMISFELLSFPFIMYQAKFSSFLVFFLIFFILWAIYVYLNREYVNFECFIGKLSKILTLICIIYFILLVLVSRYYSDSWLYAVMVSSTIENNLIYSHNGLISGTKLTLLHHQFDSYYLLQAVVSKLFRGNYLLALISEFKILEVAVVVTSLSELGYQFNFDKRKNYLFVLLFSILLGAGGMFRLVSPLQSAELAYQMTQISVATSYFYTLIIPFLLIYLKIEEMLTLKEKYIISFGTLLVFASLTTTFLYTIPLFYVSYLVYKHFILRERDVVMFQSLLTWLLLILVEFIGCKYESLFLILILVLIYIPLAKILSHYYYTINQNLLNNIFLVFIVSYILASVLLFNPLIYNQHNFLADQLMLRILAVYLYSTIGFWGLAYIGFIALLASGYIVYKIFNDMQYQKFVYYFLIYSILFLTPLAINIYTGIELDEVLSRIYAFSFIGYIIVIYCFEYIDNRIIQATLVVWFLIAIVNVFNSSIEKVPLKVQQVSALHQDFYGLENYEFDSDSFIVFDNEGYDYQRAKRYEGTNKLITVNPSLSWDPKINNCDQLAENKLYIDKFDNCYTIYDKQKAEDLNYVYETDKYLVYQNY